jgi:RimJ/RimL family protein N-acetyltransferase
MASEVFLRDVTASDLPIFFDQQLDSEATRMAAFPSRDHEAFMAHWTKSMADKTVVLQTILCDGSVAGNIVCWRQSDERLVGYWLGREYWGKGVASAALSLFLAHLTIRPLVAHVAKHNIASVRVLQKCGFTISGEDPSSSPDGGYGEEYILMLGTGERVETPPDETPNQRLEGPLEGASITRIKSC